MRALAVCLFVLSLCLSACAPMPPTGTTTVTVASSHVEAAEDLAQKTIALVTVESPGRLRPYCSGVWVSSSEFLTANHCVGGEKVGAKLLYVVREDVSAAGGVFTERDVMLARVATIVAADEDHDLVVLRSALPPLHREAKFSMEPIVPGMFVHAMGQPLGLWWSYSSGEVAAVRVTESVMGVPMVFVQTTAPISPGNSGCGLFDEYGMLVGIAHGSYNRGQNLNLIIHQQYAETLLRTLGGKR